MLLLQRGFRAPYLFSLLLMTLAASCATIGDDFEFIDVAQPDLVPDDRQRAELALRRLKAALERGVFLSHKALSPANITRVFQEPFNFAANSFPYPPDCTDCGFIWSNDPRWYDYHKIKPPQPQPIFMNGSVGYHEFGPTRIIQVRFYIETEAREFIRGPEYPRLVYPELMEKLFGVPDAMREG